MLKTHVCEMLQNTIHIHNMFLFPYVSVCFPVFVSYLFRMFVRICFVLFPYVCFDVLSYFNMFLYVWCIFPVVYRFVHLFCIFSYVVRMCFGFCPVFGSYCCRIVAVLLPYCFRICSVYMSYLFRICFACFVFGMFSAFSFCIWLYVFRMCNYFVFPLAYRGDTPCNNIPMFRSPPFWANCFGTRNRREIAM
jgi:hypothetical protein